MWFRCPLRISSCAERTRSQCPLLGDNSVPCVQVPSRGNKEAQTTEPTQVKGRKPLDLHRQLQAGTELEPLGTQSYPEYGHRFDLSPQRSAILTHSLLYDLQYPANPKNHPALLRVASHSELGMAEKGLGAYSNQVGHGQGQRQRTQ